MYKARLADLALIALAILENVNLLFMLNTIFYRRISFNTLDLMLSGRTSKKTATPYAANKIMDWQISQK